VEPELDTLPLPTWPVARRGAVLGELVTTVAREPPIADAPLVAPEVLPATLGVPTLPPAGGPGTMPVPRPAGADVPVDGGGAGGDEGVPKSGAVQAQVKLTAPRTVARIPSNTMVVRRRGLVISLPPSYKNNWRQIGPGRSLPRYVRDG
jgi:hypothetical protein